MSLLDASALEVAFGGVHALQGVSLDVKKGELVGLIGPNGAGKTTLLRMLTGILRPDRGTVHFDGRDITGLPLHRRAQLGCVLTHQIVRPFRDMTLLENVMLPAARQVTLKPWRALFALDVEEMKRRAMNLLERLGIADAANKLACNVPLGYLKRMQVARALALEPALLLLDEPLAGLNYVEATKLADIVAELNAGGMTIVLVEHNLGQVTRIVQRLVVLHAGKVLAEGLPQAVLARKDVRDAYLGGSASA